MIRRLKKDVLHQLPPKIREKVYIGEIGNNEYGKALQKMKEDMERIEKQQKEIRHSEGNTTLKKKLHNERKGQIFELHRSTGVSKLPLIHAYLDDLLKTDIDKFVIFAYHRDVLDGLAYYFKNKCEFVMITGDTSAENRKNAMDTFKSDDNCRVAILSILAANCGLEFQRASVCIFTEMTFTPGEMI